MKLQELSQLNESVSDYMSIILAKLKHKSPEDWFKKGSANIDLEDLASVITTIKALTDADKRNFLSKNEDLNLNFNSARQLYDIIHQIKKDTVHSNLVKQLFKIVKDKYTKEYEKELEKLEPLKSKDTEEHKAVVEHLDGLRRKIHKLYQQLKEIIKPDEPKSEEPLEKDKKKSTESEPVEEPKPQT